MKDSMLFDALYVSEQAAISAAHQRGRGDKIAADAAAVEAMRAAFNKIDMKGRIVIGEGERDKAPMLYIGEEVGSGKGDDIDIALDPLEGTDVCASYQNNSLSVLAFAPSGGLLNAPDVYMQKIACGIKGIPDNLLDLDQSVEKNITKLADFIDIAPKALCVCVLDRPRHQDLIAEIRATGARIKLIGDGDILAVLATTDPSSGIDLYIGSGGAPEGVLSAAALQALGGFIQGRLIIRDKEEEARAHQWGIKEFTRKYNKQDMASENIIFAATGVTDGTLLRGVVFGEHVITTESMLLQAPSGKKLRIKTNHPLPPKP